MNITYDPYTSRAYIYPYPYGWSGAWSPCRCPCCGRCREPRQWFSPSSPYVYPVNMQPFLSINYNEVNDVAA